MCIEPSLLLSNIWVRLVYKLVKRQFGYSLSLLDSEPPISVLDFLPTQKGRNGDGETAKPEYYDGERICGFRISKCEIKVDSKII